MAGNAPLLKATARSLAALFGIAGEVVTGPLHLEQVHESGDMRLRIGDTWVDVGGDGLAVPTAEVERVRRLAGQSVTAGFNVRRWSTGDSRILMGDASHLCLAEEEEMAPLVAIRQRLEKTELWFPDALVMETGAWQRFLAELPTEEGAWITEQVNQLLHADRRALAGDILSWFTRTHDVSFKALPSLRFDEPGRVPAWMFGSVTTLATVVLEAALGLKSRTLIREDWKGLDGCRRLWLLVKLLDATNPQ